MNYYQIIREELSHNQSIIAAKLLQEWVNPNPGLEQLISVILADKLADRLFNNAELYSCFVDTFNTHPDLLMKIEADLEAHFQRDFACQQYHEIFFFASGFLGLSAFRIAAALYETGDSSMAKYLQVRILEIWGMDIHPAAKIGKAVVLDHAIGVVIGSTTVIGDEVFIFQNVTLGSTGKQDGDRHPKIGDRVLIGAGASILGNITVGSRANVAAGAVVLQDVPAGTTVAGIPAKVKGKAKPVL